MSALQKLFIAIDSGGTHTRGLLCNEQGQDLDHFSGPGANPKDIGWEPALDIFRACFDTLLGSDRDRLAAACITVAGIGQVRHDTANWWAEQLNLHHSKLTILGDAVTAQLGAFAGRDGLVVVAGTGTALIVRQGQTLLRLGGWGHILGDQGSGYAIGLAGLQRAVLDNDLGIRSQLWQALFNNYEINSIHDLLEHIHRSAKAEIARFARPVLDLAQAGDQHSQHIVQMQLEALVSLCQRVLELGYAPEISYTGGLFQHPYYLSAFQRLVSKVGFYLQPPKFSALEAAKEVALGRLEPVIY